MSVPRAVAMIVATMAATTRLVIRASGESGPPERVQPGVERELAPHEVEPAGRVVERERDHDEDRDHQVEQRRAAVKTGTTQRSTDCVTPPAAARGPGLGRRRSSVDASRPASGQLLGAEHPGVDEDRDEDAGHQDERQRRRRSGSRSGCRNRFWMTLPIIWVCGLPSSSALT